MTPQRVFPVLSACGAVAAALLALTACGSPPVDASARTTSSTAPVMEDSGAPASSSSEPAASAEATDSTGPESAESDTPVATDSAPDTSRPAATDVVLSFAGWVDTDAAIEAAGYVSPVVEEGGTCTLLLTSGDRQASATSPGVADASTTACGGLAVEGSELVSGTWTAVLQYSSTTAEGTSQPVEVEVP